MTIIICVTTITATVTITIIIFIIINNTRVSHRLSLKRLVNNWSLSPVNAGTIIIIIITLSNNIIARIYLRGTLDYYLDYYCYIDYHLPLSLHYLRLLYYLNIFLI